MRRRYLFGIIGGAVLVGAAIFCVTVLNKPSSPGVKGQVSEMASFSDATSGAKVQYPVELVAQRSLTDADQKDKIVLRLGQTEGHTPLLVTMRLETGLRLPAKLLKVKAIDMLLENATKALPRRYTGYAEVSKRKYEHKASEAAEIIFTYDSPTKGERIQQKFTMVAKDEDMAVYLAMQSKQGDFDRLNKNVFIPIAGSLAF